MRFFGSIPVFPDRDDSLTNPKQVEKVAKKLLDITVYFSYRSIVKNAL